MCKREGCGGCESSTAFERSEKDCRSEQRSPKQPDPQQSVAMQGARPYIFLKKFSISILIVYLSFWFLNFLFPFPIKIDYSPIVYDRNEQILQVYLSKDEKWRVPIQKENLDQDLVKTILWKEDQWFYWHYGVNPVSVVRAFFSNLLKGKRVSGASTITMQLVRMKTRYPRTFFYKILEAIRAIQLEWNYSKDEILSFYLNLLPYGGNIEGVYTASWYYFQKLPQNLTTAEQLVLAIIPNQPNSLNIQKNDEAILQKRNQWLKRFYQEGKFSIEVYEQSIKEPIQSYKQLFSKYASHFCQRVIKKFPNEHRIETTLDLKSQLLVEQIVSNYYPQLKGNEIQNVAVLVVENKTREIIAYVGSPNFEDSLIAGQVDAVQAVRSPGSTLKPLVFGTAFENGWITPKTILLDVPMHIAGYAPQNYDEQFRGKVTAEFALSNSLNIPSVYLMKQYGQKNFIDLLCQLKFEQIQKDREQLGLSTILGGCGVTLWELVQLYSSFPNQGQWKSLKYLKNQKQDSLNFLKPETCYFIYTLLKQLTRPDFPSNFKDTQNLPEIAWKTGTSFGWKDGWSVGFSANYTIGVWVGNHDSRSAPQLNGSTFATPLLFNLFQALEKEKKAIFQMPQNLKMRKVCIETGLPPNHFCENLVEDFYLPLVSSTQKCEHLKKVFVNSSETVSYCVHCKPDNCKEKYYPNLPPSLVKFYQDKQMIYPKIPIHNPQCKVLKSEQTLKIFMPKDGAEYLMDHLNPKNLSLECEYGVDTDSLYWFINGKFYQSQSPREAIYFKPEPGIFDVKVMDNKGLKDQIRFTVKYY